MTKKNTALFPKKTLVIFTLTIYMVSSNGTKHLTLDKTIVGRDIVNIYFPYIIIMPLQFSPANLCARLQYHINNNPNTFINHTRICLVPKQFALTWQLPTIHRVVTMMHCAALWEGFRNSISMASAKLLISEKKHQYHFSNARYDIRPT